MIIYALPGLGTNHKLFVNTIIKHHTIIVLQWPIPNQFDTMESYAKKFLPQIVRLDEPYCLLGVSFGGMICVELSKLLTPQKIFLVSSSKNRSELPWYIKLLKYIPLHQLIKESYHRRLAYFGRWFIGFEKAYKSEFLEMVNSMPENYFKYCIDIIANWNGTDFKKNTIHIHGTQDRLIRYKDVTCDFTIKNGAHAMIVFNAAEINSIIEKELSIVSQ